ncbi:two-component regulator propeller domain-containing protein [Bacteroidota bacterium]
MKLLKQVLIVTILFILFNIPSLFAEEWIQYTNLDDISDIAEDGDFLWIGTDAGLVKMNKETDEKTFYNNANSGLPSNYVSCITIDSNSNNIWIGTNYGMVKYDGKYWTEYNINNSGLPDNMIYCMTLDDKGNIWIGVGGGVFSSGLVKYDGIDWTIYNKSNSGIPANRIYCISIDSNGDKWIGLQMVLQYMMIKIGLIIIRKTPVCQII